MKKTFLIKLAIHAITLPLLFALAYRGIFEAHQWIRTKNDPAALYVIGDSRVVHGLDIELLSKRLDEPVHNFATHGMSAYNIYVVADTLPAGARVLLAPSLGMFLRQREFLSFESGLSFKGLLEMARLDYEWWYFEKILVSNRYPLGLQHFRVNREGYPLTDKPDLVKIQRFVELYEGLTEPPERFRKNEALFTKAVELLLAKGCDVRIVEFPITKELRAMREKSIFKDLTTEIEVLSDPRLRSWTNLELEDREGKNLFWDMDHLNIRGRTAFTEWLIANALSD